MATDLLPSQVVLMNVNSRLISAPNVHFVFEGEEVPKGLPVDKVLYVDLDTNGSVKDYHAASKVNQIYSAQISNNENERVLQIEGSFVASSEENRSSSANPVQEHILKEFDSRNEFLRSLLRDAQTQNLYSMDDASSSDSISSVEDAWRELEDKLNSTANDVELRLSTPEDIHRYLEQSIDELDLESENSQVVIPDSFNDDLDWMSEASNESGHLNLASSSEALEADFRALSPELRPTSPFRTSESTTPVVMRRAPSPFAKRALFNLEAFS
eukprot:TRINITY_DN11166_c0_g1_i1.p1 TRINITY_DN11166_c0_g1~~TRINITY_DN11166_c0_g1_i1.p1  ORF type:complete len:271 (-),score=31.05 TRINITY_DN11166_c0_g1_i1:256-1068(-)